MVLILRRRAFSRHLSDDHDMVVTVALRACVFGGQDSSVPLFGCDCGNEEYKRESLTCLLFRCKQDGFLYEPANPPCKTAIYNGYYLAANSLWSNGDKPAKALKQEDKPTII